MIFHSKGSNSLSLKMVFLEQLPKFDPQDEDEEEVKRMTIFDTFSFFNHSCSPNVLAFFEWDCMTLITSRKYK